MYDSLTVSYLSEQHPGTSKNVGLKTNPQKLSATDAVASSGPQQPSADTKSIGLVVVAT
jgi:hypothetical protein